VKDITIEQVLYIHEQVIAAFGGDPTIRDRARVEAAVAQPRMAFGGASLYPTLAKKAAALGFSLIKGHPFLDGNKRTGIMAVLAFLSRNGYGLRSAVDESEQIVLGVASGEVDRDQFADWIRRNMIQK
jgi:death-on-curing protein